MKTESTPKQKNESLTHGLAITGLVIGILALIVSFVPCFGIFAIIIGIIGLIFSTIALILASKNNYSKGLIIAALLTSLIGCSIAYWQKVKMENAIENLTKDLEEETNQFKKDTEEFIKKQNEIDKKFIQTMKKTDEKFIKEMDKNNQKSIKKIIETQVETKKNEIDPLMSITITVDNLRVRVSPSLTAEKIENLEINTEVEYLGIHSNEETVVEIKGEKISAFWYKIKTPSGNIGWIHACCFTNTYD
ncbi:SH3 domain-containing protein [Tenacibaculum insulae]|uniref:SH3 domain-containing protein n=1 Tax=Tenacibaculum insulae TaxID=2029677 RepID=UPI003AB15AB2